MVAKFHRVSQVQRPPPRHPRVDSCFLGIAASQRELSRSVAGLVRPYVIRLATGAAEARAPPTYVNRWRSRSAADTRGDGCVSGSPVVPQ